MARKRYRKWLAPIPTNKQKRKIRKLQKKFDSLSG